MDASVSSGDMQFTMGFLKVQWPTNLIKWSDFIFLPKDEQSRALPRTIPARQTELSKIESLITSGLQKLTDAP